MPPTLALFSVGLFVAAILIADSGRKPVASGALWIPLLWLLVIASRPLILWFTPQAAQLGADPSDGSALDRNVLSILMIMAGVVLLKRGLTWKWLSANPWVFVFFLSCGLSVVWSDYPAVAVKRWIRALGSVMMILVVLSEANPVAATATLVRRCAYILVPFSVVPHKSYRQYSVGYNSWTGEEFLIGVTTDKNALGRLCVVSALFGLWELITYRKNKAIESGKLHLLIGIVVFIMTLWLLKLSNSATALATFLCGSCVLIGLAVPMVRKRVRYLRHSRRYRGDAATHCRPVNESC